MNNINLQGDLSPLFQALAKAQAAIDPAVKRSKNPHFRSRYADLSTVLDAILPPLNAQGLALMQLVGETSDGMVQLTTILSHNSGAYISAVATCPLGRGGGPQGAGSGLTYLRRYAAQAIVGLPTADDDGNQAQRPTPRAEPKAKPKAKPAPTKQHDKDFKVNRGSFMATLKNIGWTYDEVKYIMASKGEASPSQMTQARRNKMVVWLTNMDAVVANDWRRRYQEDVGGAPSKGESNG